MLYWVLCMWIKPLVDEVNDVTHRGTSCGLVRRLSASLYHWRSLFAIVRRILYVILSRLLVDMGMKPEG